MKDVVYVSAYPVLYTQSNELSNEFYDNEYPVLYTHIYFHCDVQHTENKCVYTILIVRYTYIYSRNTQREAETERQSDRATERQRDRGTVYV